MWDNLHQAREFGLLASRRRRAAGFTQDDVAAAFGEATNKSLISRIETGKTLSSPDTIAIIATKVGVTRWELEAILSGQTAEEIFAELHDAVPSLKREVLENLAQRFGHENPDAPAKELLVFLKNCAEDYKNLKRRVDGLSLVGDQISELSRLAEEQMVRGNFQEAEEIVSRAEIAQLEGETLGAVLKQSALRMERARTAMMKMAGAGGSLLDAFRIFKNAERDAKGMVVPFDPVRVAYKDLLEARKLRRYQRQYDGNGALLAADIQEQILGYLKAEDAPEAWSQVQRELAATYLEVAQSDYCRDKKKYIKLALVACEHALEVLHEESHQKEFSSIVELRRLASSL